MYLSALKDLDHELQWESVICPMLNPSRKNDPIPISSLPLTKTQTSYMSSIPTKQYSSTLHYTSSSRSPRQGRYTPDLYDLAHVDGWEPYNLHDLSTVARVSWVGSLVHRSCTTPAQPLTNGRLGSRLSRS